MRLMSRRVTLILLGAAIGVLSPTVAAQAADTYTVDAGAAAGCDASKVCKTLTAAVAAVAAGDTIVVKPGTYTEPGTITLTKKNVVIRGTAGKTTVFPAASAAAGDPTITLGEGDVLGGVSVATTTNAGPAILVTGGGTTVRNAVIVRLSPSTVDAPAYAVDAGLASGTSTLERVTIVNGPPGTTDGTEAAVRGNGTSTLAILDSLVISGPGTGPAVALTGNDKTAGNAPIANTIVRSTLVAQKAAGDALTVTSAAANALDKAVVLDSSSLLPGGSGAGLRAASLAGSVPGMDTAGDIKVTANHVTVAGGDKPFVVSAASSGAPAAGVGNIDVTFDRSIVHGKSQGTVSSAAAVNIGMPPVVVPVASANVARVVVSTSDTTQNAVGGAGDKATVTVPGKTTTPDAQLFVDLAKLNVHLRQGAPAIDRGGAAVASESATDLDGQPRQTGPATDLGADEFVNLAPVARATASPTAAKQDQAIAFDGSGSRDPEAASGGGIATFRWVFGDGTTQDTATPTVSHAYSRVGAYNATLTVIDTAGVASAPFAIPAVSVVDGTPPTVKLTAPKPGQVFKIFVTRKVTRGTRTVTTTTLNRTALAKVRFKGTATDATAIGSVQLSIRRVSSKGQRASTTTCIYLDGKTTFKSRSCKKPLFFLVQQKSGVFSYKFKSTLKPKAGVYEVTARATDAAGNVATSVKVRFRLK